MKAIALLPLLLILFFEGCVVLVPYIKTEPVPQDNGGVGAYASHATARPTTKRRKTTKAKSVSMLISQLESGSDVSRTHAATDLGMMGPRAQEAVPQLRTALLTDSSKWVRRASAKALGKIGTAEAARALEQGAKDKDKYVAHSSQRALARLRAQKQRS